MASFLKRNKVLVFCMLLLVVLLWKNPLSFNNIISDLEPSPDTIHYLNPLISLLYGKGLVISYEQRNISTNVPPLYTIFLFPLYLISKDVRFFYFTNLLLTIISAILFYKITIRLFSKKPIRNILFLAFTTDLVIYWYPSVAMAENLLIPVYLFSIWLLLQTLTPVTVILISILTVAFFATKYVAWVLSLSLIGVFIIKVFVSKATVTKKGLFLALFFLFLTIFFWAFAYTEYLNKGINIVE